MSAKYWTRRISADSSEFSVTPASSSTLVEKPRRRADGHQVHDHHRADRAEEAGERHGGPRGGRQRAAERQHQHRAQRGAGRDAEREGRGERVAQQRLEHHAGRRQRAADQRRGQHARQPRDEEDLRVDVGGPRQRPVEGAREADRACCRPAAPAGTPPAPRRSRRRTTVAMRAAIGLRTPEPIASTAARLIAASGPSARRPDGPRRRETARRPRCRTAPRCGRASAPRPSAPLAMTSPSRRSISVSHTDAARLRSCVESTRPMPRVAMQHAQQLRHLELIARIERRRRLVEQQQLGLLRQRRGDDDALLLAAAERREQPRGELAACRSPPAPRARWRCRPALSTANAAQVRIAAHQHQLEHRVVERGMRLLRHHREAPGDRLPRQPSPAARRRASPGQPMASARRPAASAASSCPIRWGRECRGARRRRRRPRRRAARAGREATRPVPGTRTRGYGRRSTRSPTMPRRPGAG